MVSPELLLDVRNYIDSHRIILNECAVLESVLPEAKPVPKPAAEPRRVFAQRKAAKHSLEDSAVMSGICPSAAADLEALLKEKDESFSDFIIRRIDASGMTDAQCYNKAQITRQLFNRIKNIKDYRPGKSTAIALGFALSLTRAEFDEMLRKAGYSLSNSSEFDLIIDYCIGHGIYGIGDINELLFSFDQPLLGSR